MSSQRTKGRYSHDAKSHGRNLGSCRQMHTKGTGELLQESLPPGCGVCIHLDTDCGYFYKDCLERWMPGKGLTYLARRAAASTDVVRSPDEPLANLSPALLGRLAAARFAIFHSMFFIVEGVGDADIEQLTTMEKLNFMQGGSIIVFKLENDLRKHVVAAAPATSRNGLQFKSADGQLTRKLQSAYMSRLLEKQPAWRLSCGFVCTVAVALVHIDSHMDQYVFAVWDDVLSKWVLPGGGIKYNCDTNTMDAARRLWNEEVLAYPFEYSESRGVPLVLSEKFNSHHSLGASSLIIAHATPALVKSFCVGKVHKLPAPTGEGVLNSGSRDLHRLHTDEKVIFVKRHLAAWIEISSDGSLVPPCAARVEGKDAIARTHFRMFRLQEPTLWAYLGRPSTLNQREDSVKETMAFPAELSDLLTRRRGPISQESHAEIALGGRSEASDGCISVHVSGGAAQVDDCLDKLEQLVDWANRKKHQHVYRKPNKPGWSR